MLSTQSSSNLNDFDFVRVSYPDINGCHLSKLIPRTQKWRIELNDVNIYGGSILFGMHNDYVEFEELVQSKSRNAFLHADLSTLCPIEWADDVKRGYKVGDVIGDLYWDEETPVDFNTRIIAINQINKLSKLGYKLYSAFEPEFRVFKKDSNYQPYSYDMDMNKTSLLSIYQDFLMDATVKLTKAGVSIQDCSTEHGEGQLEMPLMPCYGISAADQMFRTKQGLKEIAARSTDDMKVSFMTRPFNSESSSGNHFNHSLVDIKTDQPVMFDESDPLKLSTVARYWIAGIVRHLPALSALCCPTTNCYCRLHCFLAPNDNDWDIDDRFCTIRVKTNSPKSCYVENRLPSSACSPYLVLAGTVAAGIDGLLRKEEPPAPGKSNPDYISLPKTFDEALQCLNDDSVLMDAIGRKSMNYFIEIKKQVDIAQTNEAGSDIDKRLDIERKLYFDYI